MCRNKEGTWTLAGVTSWGLGCGRGWRNNMRKDEQGSPGIFTDLRKVLPWIHKHIRTGNNASTRGREARAGEQVSRLGKSGPLSRQALLLRLVRRVRTVTFTRFKTVEYGM